MTPQCQLGHWLAAGRKTLTPARPSKYWPAFEKLGNTGRYLAKAWDDRVGLAVITEALRQLGTHPNQVQVAATVQEEIGLRGAAVVEESLHPDIVINLEIGIASDFPLMTSPTLSQEALGDGPGIFVYDRSMIPNNQFIDWIIEVARQNNIPIQFESVSGYGEDGDGVHGWGCLVEETDAFSGEARAACGDYD